jgi:chemotaxis protein methyltransferase CheR
MDEARPMTGLEQVAALVHQESGIAIKPAQFPSLSAALSRTLPGAAPEQFLSMAASPAAGRPLIDRLIDEVAVKETFFFRHEPELAAVQWRGLWSGARAAHRDAVRVWSAACATGEEPYTLAMLAAEAFGSAEPPVSILGTDISRTALAQARRGEYRWRAVHETSHGRRKRWFTELADGVAVDPALRAHIHFRQHNLVRDAIPPPGEEPFDLIVCRNVLIYFDRPTVRRLLAAIEAALHPQGTLVVGAVDRLAGPLADAPRPHRLRPPAPGPRMRRPARGAKPRARPADVPAAERVRGALDDVHAWNLEDVAKNTGALLEDDPLNVDAYFVRGVAQLAVGDAAGAVISLRRALYLRPDFGLAAFKLARAHEALNDPEAARRAYVRALHGLRPDDPRDSALLDQVDLADIAIACRTRLAELPG